MKFSLISKIEQHRKSLDENGLRYFTNANYHIQCGSPEKITTADYTWAFFCESQDYLVESFSNNGEKKLLWRDAKEFGMGYWITNPSSLKKTFENIARNQYWGNDGVHDPVACSLFYFALRKKNVLLGLWKLAAGHPEQGQMLKFLSNNFEEERWQNAALKNAFALLGKQRYEYAASFFLLAGKLKDAVNVCVKQLSDPQLAISICRIYEGENGPVLSDLIENTLIPTAAENGDRWLTCMLWTFSGKRDKAFFSLSKPLDSLLSKPLEINITFASIDPDIFLLYKHLQVAYKKLINVTIPQLSKEEESQLLIECVRTYDRLGCPSLALQLITEYQLDMLPEYEVVEVVPEKDVQKINIVDAAVKETDLDWGELETKPASTGLDWGELETKPASTGLDWGELETKPASTGLDWEELVGTGKEEEDEPVIQEVANTLEETDSDILKLTAKDALQLQIRHLNIQTYKIFLVMRIVHDIHNSVTLIQEYKDFLSSDSTLSDYFGFLRKGFRSLAKVSKLQVSDIGILMAARSTEMRALSAYVVSFLE